ncbi:MAG: hypothetical protein EOM55_05390 [Clostridia bacterium]|nr:hypothetical protein [Clostridia bacterium]
MKNENKSEVFYYYLKRKEKRFHDVNGKMIKNINESKVPEGATEKTVSVTFGTVAFRQNEDGTVNRAIMICSTTENFCKKRGRDKALARLRKIEATQKEIVSAPYLGKNSTNPWHPYQGVQLGFFHATPTKVESEILK